MSLQCIIYIVCICDGTVQSMQACVLCSANFVIIFHQPQCMPMWMSKPRSPPLSLRPCLPLMLMRCIATEVKDLKQSLRFVCVRVCVCVCVCVCLRVHVNVSVDTHTNCLGSRF